MQNALLLLEVGTEEIPARFLVDSVVKMKELFEKFSAEYRLICSSARTYATPRRLTLIAEVDASQKAAEKEIWGPPVNAAFDKEGMPTKAAEAFARTNGLEIGQLARKEKGKGVYLVALVKEDAHKTEEVLPEVLQKLILSLTFPKSMRWGNSDLRFVRPVHWILATYGNKRVPFEIDGIKSITMTRGHRFLAPAPFEVRDSRSYVNLLRNNFVVVDPEERKRIIIEGARKLASSVNAALVEDEELLQHVTFLVEYPAPVLGTFPVEYLALPKELLITVMKGHQKYFALQDSLGKLTNYFVIISNTKQDNQETIRKGAERVIKPRFEDARFYYDTDRKVKLEDRLEELKKVIYHERLGTLYEKSRRIASIADFVAEKCCPEKRKDVTTAALLAKTDLLSGVVREFPELQGIMGGYYAAQEGLSEEIARALSEQYLPAFSGDRLPSTDAGAVVSLSDKLDNLASFFMMGQAPTGSEDPFALRRQAIGVISLLTERRYALTIEELFERALDSFRIGNKEQVVGELVKFFEQRLDPLLQSAGYPFDAIAAVLPFAKEAPLYTLKERLNALQQFRQEADSASFLLAIKRVNNIAPKEDVPPVDTSLLAYEEEKSLYREVEHVTPHVSSLLQENKYYDALKLLMTLKDLINRFFDKVLIMDKDERIKGNRLSLIRSIQALARQIADLSKLG
ncbi:MAG: glycine--tRNA ligase subunit beta [Alphaproteobacteria bacterium]|uniref:Glycine--tRNA ligase beta subunit n=1 Tax=Candidatus Nitrobium versatile TaxID=2884831 RepID=A0A953M2T8_9BACT|nr:glycine--tRNA ligase subunit beta [Candidatus Nitrobium versatile]